VARTERRDGTRFTGMLRGSDGLRTPVMLSSAFPRTVPTGWGSSCQPCGFLTDLGPFLEINL
jgi:hypothetical protein